MRGAVLFVAGLLVGVTGLVVGNAAEAVAAFKARGLTVTDTTRSDTGVNLANITDPYMGRVELVEITPDSMHKAIQNWK